MKKLNTDKISLPNFFLRRILRIWPLFYAMLLLCLPYAQYSEFLCICLLPVKAIHQIG